MTLRELITYSMHFDLDTKIVFKDNNDNTIHDITTDDKETYLGNGMYNKTPNHIIIQKANRKTKQ